jgi:hypothetical protein
MSPTPSNRRSRCSRMPLRRERTVWGMTDKKPEETDADHDLSGEKLVAPEENIPWLPEPQPTDGDAPAP